MEEYQLKKQILERFQLIQSKREASHPHIALRPDSKLLDLVFELLQGQIEFDPTLFSELPLNKLTIYLSYTHAYYTNKIFFELEQTLHLLVHSISSNYYLEAINLLQHYQEFKNELTEHILEEDQELIPYILWLSTEASDMLPSYGLLLNRSKSVSLRSFLLDHRHDDHKHHLFYTWVEKHYSTFDSNSLYRIFGHQLQKFALDLKIHSLIEESVVLPRAISLENELIERSKQFYVLN